MTKSRSSTSIPSQKAPRIEVPKSVTSNRPGSSILRKRILLVDDDPGIRGSVGAVLCEEGYLVLPARDGQEAITLAAATEIDLVMLDLNMPVRNGWDTFDQLSREHPLTPVIIATARPNQLFTALGAGVGALMEKPIEIPILLATIDRLLTEPREAQLKRLAGKPAEFSFARARSDDSGCVP